MIITNNKKTVYLMLGPHLREMPFIIAIMDVKLVQITSFIAIIPLVKISRFPLVGPSMTASQTDSLTSQFMFFSFCILLFWYFNIFPSNWLIELRRGMRVVTVDTLYSPIGIQLHFSPAIATWLLFRTIVQIPLTFSRICVAV